MKPQHPQRTAAIFVTSLFVFSTTVLADANISLGHTVVSASSMPVGSQVTYRMVVTNSGDVDLSNLLLAPIGTAYFNPSADNTLAIGALAAGAQLTLEWTINSLEPVDLVPQSTVFFHGEALDHAGNPVALAVSSTKEGE